MAEVSKNDDFEVSYKKFIIGIVVLIAVASLVGCVLLILSSIEDFNKNKEIDEVEAISKLTQEQDLACKNDITKNDGGEVQCDLDIEYTYNGTTRQKTIKYFCHEYNPIPTKETKFKIYVNKENPENIITEREKKENVTIPAILKIMGAIVCIIITFISGGYVYFKVK